MTARTPAREWPAWLVWLAGGAVVVAVGGVGLAVVQPFSTGPVGFDSAASVAFFERIVSGQRLEAFLGATPKPLLTLIYGVLHGVSGDWRAISWATIGAFAVSVLLAARLVGRLAGPAAAVFAVVGLVSLPLLQSDLLVSYATPWAMLGWFGAGLLVTGERPRFGWAGIALLLATLARLETLAVVAALLAMLVVAAVVRWSAGWVARRNGTGSAVARRWLRLPAPPRRAWLIGLGLLALPVMLVHDWLLTGDAFYWTYVSQVFSAAAPGSVDTPGQLRHVLDSRYLHQPVLTALAVLGGLVLVRGAVHRSGYAAVGAGLLGLAGGVVALLLVLAARHTYVSTRYFAAVDVAVVTAAAIGVGVALAWLVARLPAMRAGPVGRATVAVALAVVAALAAQPVPAPLSTALRTSAETQRTLTQDADAAVPTIRAALDEIPHARDAPPQGVDWRGGDAGPPVLLGPDLLRPRLAVDLDLPLSAIAGLAPASVKPGPGFLGCAVLVLHERSGDAPVDGYAVLEVPAPTTVGGDVVLTPLIADAAAGYWLLKIERSGAAASACGAPAG